MAIILRLDRVMADRKISLNELARRVGISTVNLSNLKTGKVKAIRFSNFGCLVKSCTVSQAIFWNTREQVNSLPISRGGQKRNIKAAERYGEKSENL